MRYTVLLSSGTSVLLKPANLLPEGSEDEDGGGMAGGFSGMSQVLDMLPQWLREKVVRGQIPDMADLQRILPPGVTTTHVAGVFALFVLTVLKFGLLRAALLWGLIGFVANAGFGSFSSAGGGVAGVQAAVQATGQRVSRKLSDLSQQRVQLSPSLALGALAVVAVAVLYFVLFSGGAATAPSVYDSYSAPHTYTPPPAERMTLEQAYELGYADAKRGAELDWAEHAPRSQPLHYSSPPPQYSAAPAPSGGLASMFSFGKIFTLGLLAKQLHGLGATGGGGWNPQMAWANLLNQSAMQKGFLALMVLRLFGMSPI